jgi:predicted MFS family arabinose efflux permease
MPVFVFRLYQKAFSGLSRQIWLLALITLINRSGTMVLPFLSVYLTKELHWDYTQTGLAMSCIGAGSFVGSYLGGWLTDRIGYFRVILGSLLMGGLLFFVLMQVEAPVWFCLTGFLLSTVGDAFRPANFVAVTAYSSPDNRTRSMSLIRMAVNLGFGIGPALGGLVAFHWGYDWLFVIDGATCVGAALTFFALLPDPVAAEKPTEPLDAADAPVHTTAQSPYRDGPFMLFLLFLMLNAVAFMQLFHSLPVYFKEQLSMGEDRIGWLMALNGLLIVAVEMPLVYALENRFRSFLLVGSGMMLMGLSYVVYPLFGPYFSVALLSVLLITVGEMAAFPFSNAFVMSRAGEGNRGRYMGAYSMSFAVASIVAPTLGLNVAGTWGFDALWLTVAAMSCAAGAGVWWLFDEKKKPDTKA